MNAFLAGRSGTDDEPSEPRRERYANTGMAQNAYFEVVYPEGALNEPLPKRAEPDALFKPSISKPKRDKARTKMARESRKRNRVR